MILEKITKEELQFMEDWHNPQCLIECLFSDFDNLSKFDDSTLGEIRPYQLPMISFEPLIDSENPKLTQKENFNLRKTVGDIYNFGGRKFGKTLCTEKLDIPISMLHDDNWSCGFSSIDAIHIKEVLDNVKQGIEYHPILKLWKRNIRTAPTYKFEANNGWVLHGINMNIKSKSPGSQFYGKHVKKLWIEEASFESDEVFRKRTDALSELGAVLRFSGMTNFTKYSPAGVAYYDLQNRPHVLNLPQFINPFWDEEEKQSRIKKFGGEDSISYRVFVGGEVVESGISEFDMERVRINYQQKKQIKRFEISKDKYNRFKSIIVVERPKNANRIFIASDIGESSGSDIIVLSEVDNKYNYLYNIVLYDLTHDEQDKVFTWLIEQLEANVVAIDCGDGTGRAVYRNLEKKFSKENLVWYAGREKINIDFEKDENNEIIIIKGEPVYLQEYMSEWSVRRLKVLLYENRCNLPLDYKFDVQFNSVVSMKSGTRTVYECISESDHHFSAWRVFAIAQWLKSDFNQTKPIRTKWATGCSSWAKNKEER